MLFEQTTVARGFVVTALAVAVLILVIDYCDARGRGGGGRGGGGRGGGHFGGGGYGGRAHISNGFHHRPPGGGNYHRPGGGGAHVDNSLPGWPGDGIANRPGGGRPNRPGDGGDHNRPGNGGGRDRPSGGNDNNYYFGWDNPTYGQGVATGLAIGTYVYNVPPNCVYEEYGGLSYRKCGDVWYQPSYEDAGIRFVVVKRPHD